MTDKHRAASDEKWNTDIGAAPYMTVLLVKNEMMDEPVEATRGYIFRGMVHENNKYFSAVGGGGYFNLKASSLVCPTMWRIK